jgi:PAS domain S-box-containing protein
MAPPTIEATSSSTWPIHSVTPAAEPLVVDHVAARFRGLVVGPDDQAPSSALLLPLRDGGESQLAGVLILGVNPLLPFDGGYREFLILVAAQTEAALAEAHSRNRERQRLQRLAELDRAKTEFYSNISHEFRTPLTLLLSPLDELTRRREEIPADLADEMEAAARNARRLLNLVDTLLDFSKLEAGQLQAHPQPTDLAALTASIASLFRSAAQRAGLGLSVKCPPLPAPVWVDRDMWEKVVSNLLSNALKHTFHGEIAVELRHRTNHAELIISDTGTGIPDEEIPHIFERFHRVPDARARSHEGSGIGLSLVQELIRLHYGRIRVRSKQDSGTTFTVWIPVSPPAGAQAETGEAGPDAARIPTAAALATAASRWDTGDLQEKLPADILGLQPGEDLGPALRARATGAHVLVVDDNADMRAYLARLLGDRWNVSTARNGEEALYLARRLHPDLVLADVIISRLDGMALLQAIRADPRLADTLVVLITARAGQDAAVEGLLAGADDYIAKPFSARELVARVGGQLALARVRREGQDRFRALINASWDVVYRMSPDWTQMRELDGHGFIADTSQPSTNWLDEYIHPDDQAKVLEVIQAAIRDKVTFELEHRVRRPDGSLAWTLSRAIPLFDEESEIIEWVGAAADVTQRKRAEQHRAAEAERREDLLARRTTALSDIRERFQALAEASANIVWATDAQGLMTEDSPSGRAFTGQNLDEWLGRGWIDAVHPEDRGYAERQWQEAVRNRTAIDTRFRLWHAPTRSWRHTQVRAIPLYHEDGTVRGWMGMNIDLTAPPDPGQAHPQ